MPPEQDNLLAAFMRARELQTAGRLEAAAGLWDEIVRGAPRSAEAWTNAAGVLLELGRFEAAEAAMRRALELAPEAAWTRYHWGRLLHLTHRFTEAESAYGEALVLAPGDARTRLALGYLHLTLGDCAKGWPLYEARTEVAGQNARKPPLAGEWDGAPLAGKSLLVWPEQGFGDQIQFARFAPVLRDLGAAVTLVAPPELSALFAELGVTVVEQTAGPMSFPTPDGWSLLLSLPGRLGVTLQDLPAAPYLSAPADRRAKWAGYAPKGAVGVAWRGRPTHGADRHRSLPARERLKPLEDAGARLIDLTNPIGDFADLAAVVEQLDLVVTVDTALAHLAGALGKPCFVLLPWFRTDWRWLRNRTDSPWYPSLSLFRQPAFGDWDSAIEQAASAYVAQFGG